MYYSNENEHRLRKKTVKIFGPPGTGKTTLLLNHLDKLSDMTDGAYKPKVIIRVAVGLRKPVDPQEQHIGDFSEGFSKILKNIKIIKLEKAEDIMPAYIKAYNSDTSTILVEQHQFY